MHHDSDRKLLQDELSQNNRSDLTPKPLRSRNSNFANQSAAAQ